MAPRKKKITGRLQRLHGSRVRHTAQSGEGEENRVFLAADVEETDAPREMPLPSPIHAPEVQEHGGFAVQTKTFPGEHRHGKKPLAAALEWTDPTSVLGLGEASAEDILFLDIETAGLRNNDAVICVGVAFWSEKKLHTIVWNLLDEADEGRMLQAFAETASTFASVCTFNGKTFDVPRLNHRFEHFALESPLAIMTHIDLVFTARRQLPRQSHALDLQTLERTQLGFTRAHDLPGREVPRRWNTYLETGNPSLLLDVVDHNLLDVVSLAALLGKFARGAQLPLPIGGASKRANVRGRRVRTESVRQGNASASSANVSTSKVAQSSNPTTQPSPLSPMQKKLARSYRLREKSGDGQPSQPTASRTPPRSSTGEDASQNEASAPPPTLPTRERATALRTSIQDRLAEGASLQDASSLIFELVAIAPRHVYGLEKLAAYYRAIGAVSCARDVEARLSRISPY